MRGLAQLIESELDSAIFHQDKDAIKRFSVIVSENINQTEEINQEQENTKNDLRHLIEVVQMGFESMDKRFEMMQKNMDKRFESMDKRFEMMQQNMDKRFESIDKRFEMMQQNMDKRFESMDKRFETIQKNMDKRFESMDKRFEMMQQNMDKRFEELWIDINKRFEMMFKFLTFGFTILSLLLVLFKFIK